MEYGILECPKCRYSKMSGYSFWASRIIFGSKKQWLFYNRIKGKSGWRYCTLCYLSHQRIYKFYDPCGFCFNPCSENDKKKCTSILSVIAVMILIIIIYFFLYLFYLIFLFWFDVCYCLCGKEDFYLILSEKGELITPVYDGLWKDLDTQNFTEEFWIENFSNLFKCDKCLFKSNTFKTFLISQVRNIFNNQDNAAIETNISHTAINYKIDRGEFSQSNKENIFVSPKTEIIEISEKVKDKHGKNDTKNSITKKKK